MQENVHQSVSVSRGRAGKDRKPVDAGGSGGPCRAVTEVAPSLPRGGTVGRGGAGMRRGAWPGATGQRRAARRRARAPGPCTLDHPPPPPRRGQEWPLELVLSHDSSSFFRLFPLLLQPAGLGAQRESLLTVTEQNPGKKRKTPFIGNYDRKHRSPPAQRGEPCQIPYASPYGKRV